MNNIKHILFVCTGNSCRSIMAEGYLEKKLEEDNLAIEVKSAGTLGINGMLPTKEALQVLVDEGIDPSKYESKALTEEFIEWADVILVMQPEHKKKVLTINSAAKDKVHCLTEFNSDSGESTVSDPIGMPLDYYKKTFSIIKKSTEGFVKWLER